uniref:chaperone protein dnaJ 20, chloroplastic-like n=1 Tax=Erigeron canadensis TaxID=72917 RepID=UPI001CB8E566|nr:chaperone protein dnaJ 20, chloroplastic-like [Erigeron canadensis]
MASLKMNIVSHKKGMFNYKDGNMNYHIKNNKIISCRIKESPIIQRKNFYQLLSLESQDITSEDLKKAYRAKALQLHPDVCPPSIREECTKQFVEIQEAYQVLSDPDSRRAYDNELILIQSFGYDSSHLRRRDENKDKFSRNVWKMQLVGLQKRSTYRIERDQRNLFS